jgi:hypothetical protein
VVPAGRDGRERAIQQGQVFQLKRLGRDGQQQWEYWYRSGGRDSRRIQRGGFISEQDAIDALNRELDRVRREQRIPRSLTFANLVEVYLAQHDVQPVTIEKLRWLLSKASAVFGDRRIGELTSQEIAEWRMNLSRGAAPQLAFRNSQSALRLYLAVDTDPLEYARRWEDGDLSWVGAHSRADVHQKVWPWLKSRGYATDEDADIQEGTGRRRRGSLTRRPPLPRAGQPACASTAAAHG